MNQADTTALDAGMMRRCLALAKSSAEFGEYPYAAVVCRNGEIVCEATNRVTRDRDVTRHAELIALSDAQKALGQTSLDDCTLYANVEPCAYCSYAIRETRIGRVVYGLNSPFMGGHSRWSILADKGLSDRMPEVFASPPKIVAGYMAGDAVAVFRDWNPVIWEFIESRGVLTAGRAVTTTDADRSGPWQRLLDAFRRIVIDRIGRK